MSECCTEKVINGRVKDRALMGPAHASSAAGFFLLAIALAPDTAFGLFGVVSFAVVLLTWINATGASLVPDLDNTNATVINRLGLLGAALSTIFRASSKIIQKVVKTKKDTSDPDPHRGFWHTFVGAGVLGFLVYLGASTSVDIDMPVIGDTDSGEIFAFFISMLMLHLALAGTMGKTMEKMRKTPVIGELASFIVSGATVGVLFTMLPDDLEYGWLGWSIFAGASIHILGDALTKAGVPLFFPIIGLIRGKMWWTTRFTTIEASSKGLNATVTTLSLIVAIPSFFYILNYITTH